MNRKELKESLDLMNKESKQRNFDEAIELIVSLKNINLKNPSQRVDFVVNLPNPYITKVKTAIFLKDKNLAQNVKGIVDKVIFEEEISKINKKECKKLADQYDLFLAEGPVMLTVGKYIGQVLGPRGKMPQVVPADSEQIKSIIKGSLSKQKISNKKNKSSVAIQVKVGKRSQGTDKLAENIKAIYDNLLEKLPAGTQNIKHLYVKTTMGPSFKVGENK